MPHESSRRVALAGLTLPEARTGQRVDLGAVAGPAIVTVIRHRY